ncbi:hypothetical protein F5144DRAFT_401530 [Chaetomium tenue]|uniref:Uncharacterized protein n=1 Tax=Chaetomium tenue TaxID=1854479 RepID=A0ACB7NVR4_9PEZI|nr:hypothetical protein F5144DRAFT_401530 [Chaetomium globosum]
MIPANNNLNDLIPLATTLATITIYYDRHAADGTQLLMEATEWMALQMSRECAAGQWSARPMVLCPQRLQNFRSQFSRTLGAKALTPHSIARPAPLPLVHSANGTMPKEFPPKECRPPSVWNASGMRSTEQRPCLPNWAKPLPICLLPLVHFHSGVLHRPSEGRGMRANKPLGVVGVCVVMGGKYQRVFLKRATSSRKQPSASQIPRGRKITGLPT